MWRIFIALSIVLWPITASAVTVNIEAAPGAARPGNWIQIITANTPPTNADPFVSVPTESRNYQDTNANGTLGAIRILSIADLPINGGGIELTEGRSYTFFLRIWSGDNVAPRQGMSYRTVGPFNIDFPAGSPPGPQTWTLPTFTDLDRLADVPGTITVTVPAGSIGYDRATANWTVALTDRDITTYQLQYRQPANPPAAAGPDIDIPATPASGNPGTYDIWRPLDNIDRLRPGTLYEVRVILVNNFGSSVSSYVPFTTVAADIPANFNRTFDLQIVMADPANARSVRRLTWRAVGATRFDIYLESAPSGNATGVWDNELLGDAGAGERGITLDAATGIYSYTDTDTSISPRYYRVIPAGMAPVNHPVEVVGKETFVFSPDAGTDTRPNAITFSLPFNVDANNDPSDGFQFIRAGDVIDQIFTQNGGAPRASYIGHWRPNTLRSRALLSSDVRTATNNFPISQGSAYQIGFNGRPTAAEGVWLWTIVGKR